MNDIGGMNRKTLIEELSLEIPPVTSFSVHNDVSYYSSTGARTYID